jgi:hypothetical protein
MYQTKNLGLGRTTISTTVLERLWADAVRRQILAETVR